VGEDKGGKLSESIFTGTRARLASKAGEEKWGKRRNRSTDFEFHGVREREDAGANYDSNTFCVGLELSEKRWYHGGNIVEFSVSKKKKGRTCRK